jgi:exopolyphosphatase/guanosine-5'-triphosphate,3'-diphosphate pyrophosphatase
VRYAPSSPERVASIDIGTNTILLLIAEVGEDKLRILFEAETLVRLGEGLQKNRNLSQEAMKRGLQTLAQYMKRCKEMEVQQVFAVGTSALREAKNSRDFLEIIEGKLNLSIQVISAEEEARLSYLAVARDLKESERPIVVVDVGGGSTEFILGKGDRIIEWVSLSLGIVRFTERFLHSDPIKEEEWEEMVKEIRKLLFRIPHPKEPFTLVSIGGTGTTLASVEQSLDEFIPEKIHHFVLTKEALGKQLLLYRLKTDEERRNIKGLPASRADVILTGGAILHEAMEELRCPSVLISCHGVRYGLIYKKIENRKFQISN